MMRKRKKNQDQDTETDDQLNPKDADGTSEGISLDNQEAATGDTDEVEQDPAAEIAELKNRLQRTTAEFMNFRKQAEKRQKDARQFIRRDVFEQVLPIVDNFGAAMNALDQGQDASNVLIGVKMIQEMLEKLLIDNGIKGIDSVNKPFDPRLHEAVSREEREDIPANTNLKEVARGYTMGDLVLRHARVVVSMPPEAEGDGEDQGEDPDVTDEDQGS